MIRSIIVLDSFFWTSLALCAVHLAALVGMIVILYGIFRKVQVMSSTEYAIWQAVNDMRQTYRQAGLPVDDKFGDGLD